MKKKVKAKKPKLKRLKKMPADHYMELVFPAQFAQFLGTEIQNAHARHGDPKFPTLGPIFTPEEMLRFTYAAVRQCFVILEREKEHAFSGLKSCK